MLQKAVPLQPISNFAIVIAQTIASKLEVDASVRDASELRLNKRKLSVTRTCIEWPLAYETEHKLSFK